MISWDLIDHQQIPLFNQGDKNLCIANLQRTTI
jgi:hypothetical protein